MDSLRAAESMNVNYTLWVSLERTNGIILDWKLLLKNIEINRLILEGCYY